MEKSIIYKFFSNFIHKETGIFYPEANYYQLDSRLESMRRFMGLDTIEDVYHSFQKSVDPCTKQMVIDLATNNETFFFRDSALFWSLAEKIIPEIAARPNFQNKISIWSAACSTGQEPYSMLIAIKEKLPQQLRELQVSLSASDISLSALERARSGLYTQLEIQRGMPIVLLTKYFIQNADAKWMVAKDLASSIKFFQFNLLKDLFPVSQYDIIFCRNMLIYQNLLTKKEIVAKINDSLKPGGFLVLGSGETLMGVSDCFAPRADVGGFIFQKTLGAMRDPLRSVA